MLLNSYSNIKDISHISIVILLFFYIFLVNYDIPSCCLCMKICAAVLLVLECIFSAFFGTEEVKLSFPNSQYKKKNKNLHILYVIGKSIASVIVVHVFTVLFGAYVFEQFNETFSYSCLIATLIFICPLLKLGRSPFWEFSNDWDLSNSVQTRVLLVVFGSWLGAFVIPLDWDRPWQRWPLPCVFGAIFGEVSSSSLVLWKDHLIQQKLKN